MNVEHIKQRITNGFKPFTVCLSDGRKIPVPHPESLAVGHRVVVIIGEDDRVNTVDPVQIVSFEETIPST